MKDLKYSLFLLLITVGLFSLSSTTALATTYVSGPLTRNTRWEVKNGPYVVGEGFVIPANITLTIAAGAIVKFDPYVSTPPVVLGSLISNGYDNKKINFTSLLDDTIGGDTNQDGEDSSPSDTDWSLSFENPDLAGPLGPSSYLGNTNIRYMREMSISHKDVDFTYVNAKYSAEGFRFKNQANLDSFGLKTSNFSGSVFFSQGEVIISNRFSNHNLAQATQDAFILMNGATVKFDHSNISNGPAEKSVVVAFGSDVSVDNSNLVNNQGPILLGFEGFGDSRLSHLSLFFTSIRDSSKEGIGLFDGATLKMDNSEVINTGGLALGVVDSSAVVTHSSFKKGQNSGIGLFSFNQSKLTPDPTLTLNDVEIESYLDSGILSFDSKADIQNSIILKNGYGLEIFTGGRLAAEETFKILGSGIYYNTNGGVMVFPSQPDDPAFNIQATKNWWGGPTGPYHPTQNCHGKGNSVSDNVDFSPFIASSNYQGLTNADPTGCSENLEVSGQSDTLSTKNPTSTSQEHLLEIKAAKETMIDKLLAK